MIPPSSRKTSQPWSSCGITCSPTPKNIKHKSELTGRFRGGPTLQVLRVQEGSSLNQIIVPVRTAERFPIFSEERKTRRRGCTGKVYIQQLLHIWRVFIRGIDERETGRLILVGVSLTCPLLTGGGSKNSSSGSRSASTIIIAHQ